MYRTKATQYIFDLLAQKEEAETGEVIEEISYEETEQFRYLVDNGYWENLPDNKVFLSLSAEGQVQTFVKALGNRISELSSRLIPLGRGADTREAYIQLLNRMSELQKLQKEILNRFYKEYGKRHIDKSSKGRKIDF